MATPSMAKLKPTARASMLTAMLSITMVIPREGSLAWDSALGSSPDFTIRPPHHYQQQKRHPVTDRLNEHQQPLPQKPAQDRKKELKKSEMKGQPEYGPWIAGISGCRCSQTHCSCIHA